MKHTEINIGCVNCLSRRSFLELSSKSISALALLGPVASLFSSCGQQPLSSGAGTGSSTHTVPASSNNIYSFSFADYPSLQTTGSSIHAVIQAGSGNKDVYITRTSTSTVVTLSTVCTHAGCTINGLDSSTQTYTCPCHQSIFNADGSVKQGPATTALPSYPTTLTSTGVQVTIT